MEKDIKVFMDNLSSAPRKSKARSFTFYLDEIKEFGFEFEKLEAFCTDGDICPPYPYQWRAVTKIQSGQDDPFEGIADEPLRAVHNLWYQVKDFIKNPPSMEEDEELYF